MKRNRVAFLKPEEPAFIRKIKERIGYQESPDVDTKREELQQAEQFDVSDRKDEKPTIDLESSNVTQEEADSFIESQTAEEGSQKRVMFKKPTSKKDSHKSLVFSSNETKKPATQAADELRLEKKRKNSDDGTKSAKLQLLSFNEEDE